MTRQPPTLIHSRDNTLLKELRRLSQDASAYRRLGEAWLEGEHLVAALRERAPGVAVRPGQLRGPGCICTSPGARWPMLRVWQVAQ